MPLDPVETLQMLIRTPSVNPMGRHVTGQIYGETRVTALLEQICEEQGWPCARQRVDEGRFNLLVLVAGSPIPQSGGQLILWDVHQDTVPVDGMTVDPFGGEVRDGRVYGRGACDVKGSMAAMLAALSRVTGASPSPTRRNSSTSSPEGAGNSHRPNILLACTVNEECGFTGSRALSELWDAEGQSPGVSVELARLLPRRPDFAIAAEPTLFDVVVAHHGSVRWRCHTVGRAAHTSRPDAGVNAIYAMAQVVRAVEQYHVKLCATPEHPLCGRPSVCVSTIHGGVGINTVPERATIEIDRRLGPAEQPETAYAALIQFIREQADVGKCQIEHDPPFMESGGLSDLCNRSLAESVTKLVRDNGRPSVMVGVPYGTDAAILSAAGVPTVVFGPGSIAQAHTADEFIAVDQLEFATDIFYQIACGGLGEISTLNPGP